MHRTEDKKENIFTIDFCHKLHYNKSMTESIMEYAGHIMTA